MYNRGRRWLHVVFKLFIDKSRAEEVTAAVHERTALIDEIERLVLQESITDKIPGYEDDMIVMLQQTAWSAST